MLEFIKSINSDYAGVLSLLSSLVMVIVTIIYVGHTKRQADYSKESAELVAKQMKTDKQPCVVPHIVDSYGTAWDVTEYTRIQLGFEIDLENVGDAPAINVYTLADFELQFKIDDNGNKKMLSASLLPNFVQAISVGEKKKIRIHFETAEVNAMVKELTIAHEMNTERIRTNPSQHYYTGAKLVIRVFFKNIMGQWCESLISHEIAWLEYKNPPPRKTQNLNENTIPPKQIYEGDEFRAVLSSHHLAPFTYKMTTDEYLNNVLSDYVEESPWLSDILGKKTVEYK